MTPKQCRDIWRGSVPNLIFDIKGFSGKIELSQSEKLPQTLPHILIEAKIDKSPFKLFIEQDFILDIFSSPQIDVDLEKLSPSEAAIIIEHIFTQPLEQLEHILDGKITILRAAISEEKPRIHGLGFIIKTTEKTYNGVFVNGDFASLNRIAKALSPFYAPKEKAFPDECDVIIGPIQLSQSEIDNLRINDLVSIGQEMNQEVKGYIVRKSGTFWHADLEPKSARIISEPGDISQFLQPTDEIKFAGIKIGQIKILANEVAKVRIGDKFQIERIEDNIAHLIIDGKHIASGHLQNLSNVLCLAISEMEMINADG